MPHPTQPGELAKYKYQTVKYYPFGGLPGMSLVLTADPWSYLSAWLGQRVPNSRGIRRKRLVRARYYAQLAEQFHKAAENTDFPTKATLAYYSMLNLTKCFVSVKGVELETVQEHHGVTLPFDVHFSVEIHTPPSSGINIFHELAAQLGTPVTQKKRLALNTLVSHIPELHEIAHSLQLLSSGKRHFLPIEIELLVNAKKNRLFSEIRYEKLHEARVNVARFFKGRRKEYFKEGVERDVWIVHRSRSRKPLTQKNMPRLYKNVVKEYRAFDVAAILTRSGYRFYCDLNSPRLHHLCYAFMILFYAGTAARYRPAEVEELLSGERRPILSEALGLCPKQFLYQIVSRITERTCVVPYARL